MNGPPTDVHLLRHFESLGNNCEFGLVQGSLGINQLGLFRFNSAGMESLLKALDTGFAGLDQADRVQIEIACNNELLVRVLGYEFRYHTFYWQGDVDLEALRVQQAKVVKFLARKMDEDLRSADKIFVRKGADSQTREDIEALCRVLDSYGPVTLLWVVAADEEHPAGSVEAVRPRLLKGYIDRFAFFEDAGGFSFAWFEICRNAYALWRGNGLVSGARAQPEVLRYRPVPLNTLAAVEDGARCILLQHAIVHGTSGIITVGDKVVAETLEDANLSAIPSSAWDHEGRLVLPNLPRSVTVPSAYHVLAGRPDHYHRWLADFVSRFRQAEYDALANRTDVSAPPVVLIPHHEAFWVLETMRLVVPRHIPRLALPADCRICAQQLLYGPRPGAFEPHPASLAILDVMRKAALRGQPPKSRCRRLYISSSDKRQSRLANEAEVVACAERAGFAQVALDQMPVADQIRLFAQASHVLAPHAPELIGIAFCQPGAVLFEIQSASSVDETFQRVAASCNLHYRRLTGPPAGECGAWQVDIAAIGAMLSDQQVIGDPCAREYAAPIQR
jgi:capsular polysaccharide biosynthesis protein